MLNEYLSSIILDVLGSVAFGEFNNSVTRKRVQKSLSDRLPEFDVICDDVLNTPERIGKRELWFSLECDDKAICCYSASGLSIESVEED